MMIDSSLQAARDGAVYYQPATLSLLQITGSSRLDLLHRMSTQDLRSLTKGQGAATVLTTDIGRIIDRLILYADDESVLVVCGQGNADSVARYLMHFVFFNDDFQMAPVDEKMGSVGVYGAEAQALLAAAGFGDLDMPLHHWVSAELSPTDTITIHRTDPLAGDGYLLLCQKDALPDLVERLEAAGIVPIDDAAYEFLRVESGVPCLGRELTRDYIPLETGLWNDISFNKGCYIGQEIIARMESRGRLAKVLVNFQAADAVPAGAIIKADGKKVGTLTSVADAGDVHVALGYLKNAAIGTKSDVLTANGVPLTILRVHTRLEPI